MSKKNKKNHSLTTTTTCTPPSSGHSWYNFNGVKKETYTYKGKLNQTAFPEFVEICKLCQPLLKSFLRKELLSYYTEIIDGEGYLYCKGEIPILVTAHMDTVHKETVKDFYEYIDKNGNHIISSPQGIGGDDRCGVYMILQLLQRGYKPYILFCEDEEIGGVGSDKFCKTELVNELEEVKYLIELDRANANDAVFYDCANEDFIDYITSVTEYKEAWGSFSDISNLAPVTMISAVNLSCGYYNAHTTREEVVVEEMLRTIDVVEMLIKDLPNVEQFEYVEDHSYGYPYGDYYYGKYDCMGSYYNNKGETKDFKVLVEINFIDITRKEETDYYEGVSEADCFLQFFKDYPTTCWDDVLDYISTEL